MSIVNPGSGPAGGTAEQARANIDMFIIDMGLAAQVITLAIGGVGGGRFAFMLRYGTRTVTIDMPGMPIERVRYVDGMNPFDFPGLFVDGDSWLWKFAINCAVEALTGMTDGDPRREAGWQAERAVREGAAEAHRRAVGVADPRARQMVTIRQPMTSKNPTWHCPKCSAGAQAPARLRKNDIRRFCFVCSKLYGVMIERLCSTSAAGRKLEAARRTALRYANGLARKLRASSGGPSEPEVQVQPEAEAQITCSRCIRGHDGLAKPCGTTGCECFCNRSQAKPGVDDDTHDFVPTPGRPDYCATCARFWTNPKHTPAPAANAGRAGSGS